MKKITLVFSMLFLLKNLHAQDTTQVVKNDIYYNFSTNTKGPREFELRDHKDGKILFRRSVTGDSCSSCYAPLASIADTFFLKKQYAAAIKVYSLAFRLNNGLGRVRHRFNVAEAHAALGQRDSAFAELKRVVTGGKYYNPYHLEGSELLKPLHTDPRWKPLIEEVKANLKEVEGIRLKEG
ncbi:hypothetical protein JMG10_08445 [Nostoc ellipsosporum NOK]|nr:hypothetical protein [Nostoc ellipsosporum NOK]